MKEKKKLWFIILAIIVICLILLSIFPFGNSNKTKDMPGYTQITGVEGVSFYVNSEFTDKATAVTEISDSIDFQKNQFYSYKNGTDKYLLFNISSLVIAAQKGTSFSFDTAEDKQSALKGSSLMNIWFDTGSDKIEIESSNGATTAKVIAGVSVNKTTYGDFCGKLKTITRDGEEWALFVGVPGEQYGKLSDAAKKGIDTIIDTFTFTTDDEAADQSIYAISLDGSGNKSAVNTQDTPKAEDESLDQSNQREIVNKNGEYAYTSSPYNMLSLGDNGILSILNETTKTYEDAIICPTAVYRGEEAENIIKDFCESTKQYDYTPCAEGSSWEVIEYDLNYAYCDSATDGYVNIRIRGVDGQKLRYDNTTYTGRTYDMTYKAEKDGNWVRHLYTYYAVPNGCTQYCITAGESESLNNEQVRAAYYKLTENDTKVDKPEKEPEPEKEPTEETEETAETEEEPEKEPEKENTSEKKPSTSSKKSTANKKSQTQPSTPQPAPQPTPQPTPAPAPEDDVFIGDYENIN